MCLHHILAQGVLVRVSFRPHAIHDVTCLSVRWSFLLSLSHISLLLLPLLFLILPVLCPALHPQGVIKPLHSRRMRSLAPWRYTILSQVMSPSSSTTSPGWIRRHGYGAHVLVWRGTRWWDHRESTIFTTSFRSEKNQRTEDKLTTLMKVCCQLSLCLSVMQERGDPCMNLVRQVHAAEKNQVATQKMSKSGFSLNDKKSKFLLFLEQRFTNTSSKPILIGEVSRNWMELLSPSEEKLIILM